jgi:L-asparagine transporter-like permease
MSLTQQKKIHSVQHVTGVKNLAKKMVHAVMVVLVVTVALLTQEIQTDRSHIAHIHRSNITHNHTFTERGWQEFLNSHTTI